MLHEELETFRWRRRGRPEALYCPYCGYDLRGQTVERCPECGNEYDEDEVRREMRWQWESALAPFHTALPFLSGAIVAAATLVLVPDRLWPRTGLLLTLLFWLVVKIGAHVLRGLIMGDLLSEFRTGAGGSLMGWLVDAAGTFPWWTEILFVAAMVSRYAGRSCSWTIIGVMLLAAMVLVIWGSLQRRSLQLRGQLEHLDDVARRMLWRAQVCTIALLVIIGAALVALFL